MQEPTHYWIVPSNLPASALETLAWVADGARIYGDTKMVRAVKRGRSTPFPLTKPDPGLLPWPLQQIQELSAICTWHDTTESWPLACFKNPSSRLDAQPNQSPSLLQVGVFISRSSISFFPLARLWPLPTLQVSCPLSLFNNEEF